MVPVVLLTGFLGSGKTTLLNQLILARADAAGRFAIVVNEFGDIGIDGDLLPSGMTRQVEIPGGCICCVLNEDLDKTLLELVGWGAANPSDPDLDLIVIETTGVAEPAPISWSLAREPLNRHLRLAAVVTVVDALRHRDNRELSFTVDLQVEYADILVVSKLDLADEDRAGNTAVELRRVNPTAPLFLGTPAENAASLWQTLADPPVGHRPEPVTLGNLDLGTHRHDRHHLDTVGLVIEQTLDFEELAASLEALPANYIRIKGIARVIDRSTGSEEPHFVAFHRVGPRVSSERLSVAAPTRVVALGPGIDPAPLAACLNGAVVT